MSHELIQPESMHPTVGYTHAARVGNLLFVAGQIALNAEGNLIGEGDFEAQAHQTYRNLVTVIEAAGGTLASIVKMTTYLVDAGHIERWRTVRNDYFVEPMPPNTLCVIARLARPEFLIEVEAVAEIET
jgi:enamine deaminase RidA (YjgF/YER057c/UK114 family)